MARILYPKEITFCGRTIVHPNQTLEQEELSFPQEMEIQADSLIYSPRKSIANRGNTSGTFSVNPVTDFENYNDAFDAWADAASRYVGGAAGELVINGTSYDAVLTSYCPRVYPVAGKNRLVIEYTFTTGGIASDD